MSFKISLQDLLDVTDATFIQEGSGLLRTDSFNISTDSRSIKPNDFFLALKGERFDGHKFATQAIAMGAAGVIVQDPVDVMPRVQVADTLAAYQAIAHWWRCRLGTPIVAVTGSVGKTTTKELIAAALESQRRPVLKTRANFNNEIGVPKTLLELEPHHHYGVIEMGMRGTGQIELLTRIAAPDVAVITNVGTAHIELLGSEQAIAQAKCELLTGLDTQGVAVLNQDDPRLMATAAQVWRGRQITYGLSGGDVHGHLVDTAAIQVQDTVLPLPLPGQHNAVNLLAAIAVMEALELDWRSLRSGLTVQLPGGRSTRFKLPGDIVILDETYNAGVESMQAALRLLKQTPGCRHIAVLGTMKELGEHSVRLHQQVGQTVRSLKLDRLLTLADPAETEALAHGAAPVPVESFDNGQVLQARLLEFLQPGDRVLFKASRAIALDQVVAALKSELEKQS